MFKQIGIGMLPQPCGDARLRRVAAVFVIALTLALPLAAQSGAERIGVAAAGKAIFDGKGGCGACHSIGDRGASLGPDLGDIGITRSPKSLRLALTDPDAEIFTEYYTVVVETKGGETIRGLTLNEDDLSIQIRDINGYPRSFLKDALKGTHREQRSLMPSYASQLTGAEIDDVVAYLRTLKGPPLPPDAKRPRQPNHAYSDVGFLTRIGRDAEERPDSLVNALEIPAGASVAEIGSGTGYFTWRLAEKVGPKGKVFAVDIQQKMLDLTAETVNKHHLSNVALVLGAENDPHLPAASLDLVFIANAYHEFSNPEAIITAVNRALKPNGRLVIVEFAEGRAFGPQDKAERMTVNQIRAEIEPLGFELDRIMELLNIQHGLIFSKRP
ncbi:MAG: methyltransferase domain-containing protein [Acidobacteriota bacterium]